VNKPFCVSSCLQIVQIRFQKDNRMAQFFLTIGNLQKRRYTTLPGSRSKPPGPTAAWRPSMVVM
jgi:hypothetical protein